MIVLDKFQISELMDSAVCSGIARYEALREPHKDKLSRSEAEDYVRVTCTRLGLYQPRKEGNRRIERTGAVILRNWEEEGLIKGERGKTINSRIRYSKARIIEIANNIKSERIINLGLKP